MNRLQELRTHLTSGIKKEGRAITTFFKTGEGTYGAHDQFLNIPVPVLRSLVKQFADLSVDEVSALLASVYNEERLFALLLLVHWYERSALHSKQFVYELYLAHLHAVNNWNLVDASAHLILGAHLWESNTSMLYELAQSKDMWHRRIAIVATWHGIKRSDTTHTYAIAKLLLADTHDLIHKAVGWMLREAGKKDESGLRTFLDSYASFMPSVMFSYATEKLDTVSKDTYKKLRKS